MRRLDYGPDTPPWAVDLTERLSRQIVERHTAPRKLWKTTTAALPPAAAWSGGICFNTTLGVPVVSDGTFWYPITLGAHL